MTAEVLRCDALALPLADASIDAVVTDPPYGLEFMGKTWDRLDLTDLPNGERWAGRRTGGGAVRDGETGRSRAGSRHRVAFGMTRPQFRRCTLCGRREFSGTPCVCAESKWAYEVPAGAPSGSIVAQGFHTTWAAEALRVAKSGAHLLAFGGTRTWHRLTVGLEDAGWEIRDCLMWLYGQGFPKSLNLAGGLGTALKPGWEPIVLARKPLAGTVAANVTAHGTGALNIDAARIATSPSDAAAMERANTPGSGRMKAGRSPIGAFGRTNATGPLDTTQGRWPANVVLDEEAADQLDAQSGVLASGLMRADQQRQTIGYEGRGLGGPVGRDTYGDRGGASRFFYVGKASQSDRGAGNDHPTVKPVDLMRWLVRLITPHDGLVLDPFAGSGTTGVACEIEGRRCVLVERDAGYVDLIRQRLAAPLQPVFDLGGVA